MGSHKIDVFYYMHQYVEVYFCKYWPDNGPFRRKLVANSRITIKYYIVVSDGLGV